MPQQRVEGLIVRGKGSFFCMGLGVQLKGAKGKQCYFKQQAGKMISWQHLELAEGIQNSSSKR